MAEAEQRPEGAAPQAGGGFSWRALLFRTTIVAIVANIIILVLAGLIPPLVFFIILFIVGLVLLRRGGKAGPILLIVLFTLYLLLNSFFVIPVLTVPASAFDFIPTLLAILPVIVGIVAAIGVLRAREEAPAPAARTVSGVAIAVFVLGTILSIVATVTYDSDEAKGGDIRLVAEDIEFSQEGLTAEAGTVSVFIDNKDRTLHTFTIDPLDVDVDIPAGKSTRVTFEAEAGGYEFYCTPHESDMTGTLTVE